MERALKICVALAIVALLVAGCGKSQRTVVVPGGKGVVTTEKTLGGEKSTVEVQTKEGKATVTQSKGETVTEAELGVPVYPGAKSEISGKFEGQGKSADKAVEQNILTTKDSFDKVVAFYKSHLKNPTNSFVQAAGPQKMAMFTIESGGKQLNVHISTNAQAKQTMIQVVKGAK